MNSGKLDKLVTETSQRRYRELVDGKVEGVTGPPVFERLRAELPLTAELRAELDRRLDAYEADKLPIEERIRLVQDLWDSIATDQNFLPLTPEQRAELDRGLDAYEADGNPGRLAEDVIADIRKNCDSHRPTQGRGGWGS